MSQTTISHLRMVTSEKPKTHLWEWLTTPHASLTGETRRQARLLLGMLVVLVLLSLLGTIATTAERFVFDTERRSTVPIFFAAFLLIAFLINYVVARSKRYGTAALLFVSAPTALITIAALVAQGDAGTFFLYFLTVGTLLSSLLLSLKTTWIVAIVNFLIVIGLVLVIPGFETSTIDEILFNLMVPALLLVSASMRQGYLTQIASQVSALEQANRDVQASRDKAEAASNAKTVFLSNMSHELRTPLNTIIGYTSSMLHMPQMYKGQALPEVFRSDINLIMENGQYLLGLINDILDLSKIEADKLELNCTVVDLPALFKGVLATSIGLIKDKPLQIQPDFPDALPKVWADAGRVRQILLNLMSNAIKYTETGHVQLRAEVQNDSVQIHVIDTGVGIKPELLTTIFDRFQQVQSNTNIQGTGLGLDISQRLVAMHGSKITVKSVVGQGSTFSFTLPLATPAQLETPEALMGAPTDSSITLFEPRAIREVVISTILLVEEDAEIRTNMRRHLESKGHHVVDVADGTQVLDTATGLLPDLILLDTGLPDVDAWQIMKELRADSSTKAIPVIILGEQPAPEKVATFAIAGALANPVDASALLEAVRKALSVQPSFN